MSELNLIMTAGLGAWLALQVERGAITYEQAITKYPQYQDEMDAKLIADGYSNKIIDYYAPLIEAGTVTYTWFATKYASYPNVISAMNDRLIADGYGHLIV